MTNKHELKDDLYVGRKMWSVELGDCAIAAIGTHNEDYPIHCTDGEKSRLNYDSKGYINKNNSAQSLFYSNPFIEQETPELTIDSVLIAKETNSIGSAFFYKNHEYKVQSLSNGVEGRRLELCNHQKFFKLSMNKEDCLYWGNYFDLQEPKQNEPAIILSEENQVLEDGGYKTKTTITFDYPNNTIPLIADILKTYGVDGNNAYLCAIKVLTHLKLINP